MGVFHAADERADGFVVLVGGLTRPGDRGVGRKIAVVDTALEFGKRHHHRHFSFNDTEPLLRTGARSGKRLGYALPPARPEMTGAPPPPPALRLIHAARRESAWTSKPQAPQI